MKSDSFYVAMPLPSLKLYDDGITEENRGQRLEDDVRVINKMRKNGPIRKLSTNEILVRSMIILGTEPTAKLSIHPEGDIGGRKVKTLTNIAKLYPGACILTGHRLESSPIGRTFRSEVLEGLEEYNGAVLREDYYVLNDAEGRSIIRKVDAGIWAEGSIHYRFKEARCSICHKPMASFNFLGMSSKTPRCSHKLGQIDEETGLVCYWYPYNFVDVLETSFVFKGAYSNTKSMLSTDRKELETQYSSEDIDAGRALEEQLSYNGFPVEDSNDTPKKNTDRPASINEPNTRGKGKGQSKKPQGDGGASVCVCPECGHEEKHDKGTPYTELKCPKCGTTLKGSDTKKGSKKNEPPKKQDTKKAEPQSGQGEGDVHGTTGSNRDNNKGQDAGTFKNSTPSDVKTPTFTGSRVDNKDNISTGDSGNEGTSNKNDAKQNNSQTGGFSVPVGSEGKDTAGSITQSGTSIKNFEITKTIQNILNDMELDYDEKEINIREEMCNASKENLATVLGMIRSASDVLPSHSEHICQECGSFGVDLEYDYSEDRKEIECKICGGKVELLSPTLVEYMKLYGPVKPAKTGKVNNEYYSLDFFKDLPDGIYYVEPKYDGVWFEVHCKNGDVKLYTTSGNEYSAKFPNIVEELKSETNYILVGEMTKWRNRKRLRHEDVVSYLNGDTTNDKHFKFKPFDCIMVGSEDIRKKKYSERRDRLSDIIKFGKQVHPTAYKKVEHKKGNSKITNKIEDRKTREGAMVKSDKATYNRSGSKFMWKWKKQYQIDAEVSAVSKTDTGNFVYTCSVGRGKNKQEIGDTYTTSIKTSVGSVVTVSVDHVRYDSDKKRYTWYAPKVVRARSEKSIADPISTIKRINESKNNFVFDTNFVSLSDIFPRLSKLELSTDIHLIGGLVETGASVHDVDILTTAELPASDKELIEKALGDRLSGMVDYVIDESGPSGCSITIKHASKKKWKYANRFVIQEHGWGKHKHWDVRFGSPNSNRMWGWTCFKKPTTVAGGNKVLTQEKGYHDAKWMDFDKESISPGQPGNPTKNLKAYMEIIDKGTYEFVKRSKDFLDVILHGEHFKGRYVWRKINVKSTKKRETDGKDEAPAKDKSIWIMWKAKDQKKSGSVNKLAYQVSNGCISYWETDDVEYL